MRIASVVMQSARVLGVGVTLAVWSSDAHAAAGRADECDSQVSAMRARLSAERQAQLQGASDEDGPYLDFEPALRACFEHDVVPKLRAAEGDDALIPRAFDTAMGWFRAGQLLGFGEDAFAAEWRIVFASLTTAFTNGYAKAKARCRTSADVAAAKKLRTLFVNSAVIPGGGEELFPTFREDIAKCLRGVSYLITVHERSVAEKIGTVSDFRYLATVAPKPEDPEELEGAGSYSALVVSTPNCDAQTGKWHGKLHRLPAAGKLSAWAQALDMSVLGGPANAFQFVLATLDWPYKPLFVSRRDAVATGEDREGVAGLGTFAQMDIALTGRSTTHRSTETKEGGVCMGKTTTSTNIEVVRLGGG